MDENKAIYELFKELLEDYKSQVNNADSIQEYKTKLNQLEELINWNYIQLNHFSNRIEEYNRILLEFAQHNYMFQATVDHDSYTIVDSLGLSINLLGEELNYSTVTKYYLQDIFNSMDDILLVVNKDEKIIAYNKKAVETLNYTEEELKSHYLIDFFEDESEYSSFYKSKETGKIYKLLSKDNQKKPVALTISPFARGDNKPIGSVIIAKDVSSMLNYQKKIEEQNKLIKLNIEELNKKNQELEIAKEKAEESDRLKSIFLANVSHEIRTPLNSILGFSDLLKLKTTDNEQLKFVNLIGKSGQQLLNIISDILDISKIEVKQLRLFNETFELQEFMLDVYNIIKVSRPANKLKAINFSYHNKQSDEEIVLQADKSRLQQVLINLLNNAFKFTNSGKISYGYKLNPEELEFFVEDSGVGIAKNELDLIFKAFYQANHSHNRSYEGTGLGLSISKAIIELMGGKIWVESSENQGSTFSFSIPFSGKVEAAYSKKTADFSLPDLNNKKILVVEDNEESALYLKHLLENENAIITLAYNGILAVDMFLSDPTFDLILMDKNIDGIDGIEATRLIRNYKNDVPVILQTAEYDDHVQAYAKNLGFNDVIFKPIKPETLFKSISLSLG